MYPSFAPNSGFASDVFFAEVINIFGSASAITELWTPDGLTLSGDTVLSWRGKRGNIASNSTSNRFSSRLVEGKRCVYTGSTYDKSLVTSASLQVRSVWSVASVPSSTTSYQTLVTGASGGGEHLVIDGSMATWYNPGSTLTHYKNGEVNEGLASKGLLVFESVSTSAALTAPIRIGGSSVSGRVWLGDILLVLALPTNATEDQRARLLVAIAKYQRRLSRYSGKLASLRRGGDTASVTSVDAGNTLVTNSSVIPDAQWYWITHDRFHGTLVALANASNYVATSTDGGSSWTANANGTKGATTFYRFVYDEAHRCLVAVSETGNVCNYSTDGGATWTQVAIGITERAWFGLAYDARNKVVVAVSDGTDNSTCRSLDGGRTWSAGGSLNSIFSGTVCNVVCYDPDHERIVATNQTNKSAYSTDGGTTWAAGGNLPASRQWDAFVHDPVHKRLIAVSCSGSDRITAYSSDGGVTWTQGGTIPGITTGYFRQLVCDPVTGRVIGPLYNATPPVYVYTDDGGTTWGTRTATGSTTYSGTSMGIVPY